VTAPVAAPAAPGSAHPSLWRRTPHRPDDWFDAEALADARAYARPVNRVRMLRGVLALVAVLAFVGWDAGPQLVEQLGLRGWVLELVVVLAAFLLLSTLVSLPFDAWIDLRHDRRHDVSTQTGRGFAKDTVQELVVSLVLVTLLLVPVYVAIRASDQWWVIGWAIATVFATAMALAYPVVIMPRFNTFDPLTEPGLRGRIEAVADRAGERIAGVFVMDASRRTKRDNAFVAGWGPTKRVVLFDTMLDHDPEVIEQIVAHEIGHYRLRHIPKSIVVQALVFLGVFAFLGWFTQWDAALRWAGIESIEDPAGVGLLLVGLGIGLTATSFATAWYSRAKERQADLEALELLARPDDFIEVWRRLAPRNRAELEPSWWKRLQASHPDIAERMQFGARWADLNDARPTAGATPV
jgi:STE24 endopeptidase